MSERFRVRISLALIFLFALAIRVWYGSAGIYFDRFYDERYSMENVAAVLTTQRIQPANGYYPTMSYLPHTLVLVLWDAVEKWTGQHWLALDPSALGRWQPLYLCRLLQALVGAVTTLLVFALGRRLMSVRAGVYAALALAFMPWHIHVSGVFKPDVNVLFAVVLAQLLALRALERPTVLRSALAGAGVAIAATSKMTGGIVAASVGVALLPFLFRGRRGAVLIAAAGLGAIVCYALFNPDPRFYLFYLKHLRGQYVEKVAEAGGADPWTTLRHVLLFALHRNSLGITLGVASVAGWALLAWRACRRVVAAERRLGWVSFLVFPPAFAVFYTLTTPLDKPNNYIPVLGACALGLGYAVDQTLSVLCRFRPGAGRILAVVTAVGLSYQLAAPGFRFTLGSITPSTSDEMRAALHPLLQPGGGRILLSEPLPAPEPGYELATWYGRGEVSELVVPSLKALPTTSLDEADAELFPGARLDGPDAEFYRSRISRVGPASVLRFAPERFRVRGTEVVAIVHPRPGAREPEFFKVSPVADRPLVFAGPAPDVGPGAPLVSLSFWLPLKPGAAVVEPVVRVGDRRLRMVVAFDAWLWNSERLPASAVAGQDVVLEARSPLRYPPAAVLYRWKE